jgi:plasmid maintenance system antidote protein VapI
MAVKNPPHPGDFVRTEIVEPAGLSVTAIEAHGKSLLGAKLVG